MSYIGNAPISAAFLTDTFSGDGSTVAFTMTVAPANTSSIIVAITGVLQDPSTYSVSGTTLTFSAAPPSGTSNISVRYLGIPASGVTTTAYRTVTNFTATAGQTSFSVPSYTVGYIDVYRNGVRLVSTDYTATTGTTVVLNNACTVGDSVVTESFLVSSVLNAIPATAGSIGSSYLVSGITLTSPVITGSTPQVSVLTSGSGTYTTPTNARWLQVEAIGGGGGGASAGSTAGGVAGSAGGSTTFGTSLVTCGGGSGGGSVAGLNGGNGGTATLTTSATVLQQVAMVGSAGGGSGAASPGSSAVYPFGGIGGTSPFGGNGTMAVNTNGTAAQANSGSGGGGGNQAGLASGYAGGGGGAGGYIKAVITSPSATYSYSIGAGGAGGVNATYGSGGAGGSGVVIVTAYF